MIATRQLSNKKTTHKTVLALTLESRRRSYWKTLLTTRTIGTTATVLEKTGSYKIYCCDFNSLPRRWTIYDMKKCWTIGRPLNFSKNIGWKNAHRRLSLRHLKTFDMDCLPLFRAARYPTKTGTPRTIGKEMVLFWKRRITMGRQ